MENVSIGEKERRGERVNKRKKERERERRRRKRERERECLLFYIHISFQAKVRFTSYLFLDAQ